MDEATELLYQTMGIEKESNCNNGEINIYTIDAKLLYTVQLQLCSGKIEINMINFKPGQYLLKISDCYGNIDVEKITKNQ